jgi:hypothetical protein
VSLRDLVVAALQDIGADFKALIAADQTLRADAPRISRGPSFVPRIGWGVSGGMLTGSATGTPQFQRFYLTPFPVGPTGWTFDAFLFVVSTAYAGGTGVTFTAGLYPDDGTGFPNLAGGPIVQNSTASSNLTAGNRSVTVNPTALAPGMYWVATLISGSAAPTAGQMQCVTNNAYQLPLPSTIAPGTPVRAYILNGQTALPTAQPADSAFALTGGTDAPLMSLRRSA